MATNSTPPAGYSANNLVFSDNFAGDKLNSSAWNTYVTSAAANGSPWNAGPNGGSGVGAQYDAEYFMPSQVSVNNGLTLTATKQTIAGNPATVPETSGAISSYGKFQFTGGYLEIDMKAPAGNGSWPGLWLMPGKGATGGDNFEIDIQEGGYTKGSTNPNNVLSYHVHTPNGVFGGTVDAGVDLTAGYHKYGIDWDPGKSITWYLDGKQIGQVTSAQAPIPTEPMQLIMDEQVANSAASGWHTTFGSSTPQTMPMQVASVQLYQKSGQTVTGGNVTIAGPTAPENPTTPTTPTTPTNPTTPTAPTTPPTTPTSTSNKWRHHYHQRNALAQNSPAAAQASSVSPSPSDAMAAAATPNSSVQPASLSDATQTSLSGATQTSLPGFQTSNAMSGTTSSAPPTSATNQSLALLQQCMAGGFAPAASSPATVTQMASATPRYESFLATRH
ncbi:glycoside hydrolase family 16 protein [Methylocystis parvus]|nr:glycoside hydrolase family 16 protein [Methylocystis parvus]WBJ99754.1 family 16 glycosylhydrolase [Methylocystis parvus OBBP]